jgi:hypothetical protein
MTSSDKIHERGALACLGQRSLIPWMILIFAALSTLVVAACGSQTSTYGGGSAPTTTAQQAFPAITIKAVDFAFSQPQTVPAGFVDLTFINNGSQPHQVQFVRINNGNFDQFDTALKKNGPGAALALATLYGGANAVDPGLKEEVILNLPQGQYASICFVAGQDNVPHYMKGMLTPFRITGSDSGNPPPPKANAEVLLKDFAYVLPTSIPAGQAILKITNQGSQPHEMDLLKLAAGKNMQDFQNYIKSNNPSGPPPFAFEGGMGGIAAGSSAWLKLNLQPGHYVAMCFIPDVKTGKPHFMLGMLSSFTVA